jgi:hypothetical protein
VQQRLAEVAGRDEPQAERLPERVLLRPLPQAVLLQEVRVWLPAERRQRQEQPAGRQRRAVGR